MNLEGVSNTLRKSLPAPAFDWIRRLGTAVLTPMAFSVESGHLRSSFQRRAVTRDGASLPWYTYPAIQLLSAKKYTGRRVLEWGAGQSTLWWAERAAEVVSVEQDPQWVAELAPRCPANVTIHPLPEGAGAEAKVALKGPFDVIVVDGCDRAVAARLSIPLLAKDGVLIVDNAEGFWGEDGTYPIMDLGREHGLSRVDFYGYAPGVITQHCTSIFFRGNSWLFAGVESPSVR